MTVFSLTWKKMVVLGSACLLWSCQGKTADTTSDGEVDRPDSTATTPAPGTARIKARVDSCEGAPEKTLICRLVVETVRAYGMSTPPLGSGEAVDAEVPGRFNGAFRKAGAGETLTLSLRFQGKRGPGLSPRPDSTEDAVSNRPDAKSGPVRPDWRVVDLK